MQCATIDVASVVAIRNISHHSRLVNMHGVCLVENSNHVHLVTELLEGTSYSLFLRITRSNFFKHTRTHTHTTHNTGTGTGRSMQHYVHHESPDFNERQIMQIAHDMADGLRYLHAMGLIHGNLCPTNVLLVAPYVVFEREILKM